MKNEDIKRIVKHVEQYDVALRVNYPNGASNSETVPLRGFRSRKPTIFIRKE